MPIKVQKAYKTLNRLEQKIKSPCHIIQNILKDTSGKDQVTNKDRPIRITYVLTGNSKSYKSLNIMCYSC